MARADCSFGCAFLDLPRYFLDSEFARTFRLKSFFYLWTLINEQNGYSIITLLYYFCMVFSGVLLLQNYIKSNMDRKNQDCYFYYYSTCTKGDQCKFRHQPLALGCETVCPLWLQHKCDNRLCKLRHMELKKNRKKIPCYWENQPGGCRKPHCPFLHKFPREPLVIGRETKECEQQVSSSQPPLDRGDWSRGGYEHPQGHIQVASDGDAAMLGPRRLSQGNVAPPAPGPVPDPLVVSFDDGMRLY